MQKQALISALRRWIEQRPGLEFGNYGDIRAYRAEQRDITRDLHHARELLRAVEWRDSITAEDILRAADGRLTIAVDGDSVRIDYCTGQYFPTEYRPAASRVLSSVLWAYWRENTVHENLEKSGRSMGDVIRSQARYNLSRAVARRYFN